MQIGTSGLQVKDMKRSTLGVTRSKVNVIQLLLNSNRKLYMIGRPKINFPFSVEK